MKLFARLEANCFAWSNGDFSACSWVAADTGLAGFDGEDSKSSQLDAIPGDQGLLHAVEDGVYRRFRFGARQAGTFNHPLYKVLLNHLGPPSLALIL
jgi:hypothetical protein